MLSVFRAALWIDPLIVVATVLMGTISVLCSFFDADGRKQHAVSRAWGRMLLAISGVKVRVHGVEHVDRGQGYLFIGNHLSLMDTPVILANTPHQFLFLVNIRFVNMPFLGTHLRRAGHIAVDSSDTRKSLKALNEAAKRMIERGLSVLVFPEGSRSQTGELQEFKEGAAVIALKSGAPILPFILKGTREVLPRGSVHIRPGSVELMFGPPISTAGMALKDRAKLNEIMRARLLEMQRELEGKALETVRQ